MLIDKIREHYPGLTCGPESPQIKDAIVFYINEGGRDFAINQLTFFNNQQEKDGHIKLPSHLPYDNLFLQFNDGLGQWYIQHNYPETNDFKQIRNCTLTKIAPFATWYSLGGISAYAQFINIPLDKITELFYIYRNIPYPYRSVDCPAQPNQIMGKIVELQRFLNLLSCKNIRITKCNPNTKVQKKRIKKKKLPLCSYYILELKPVASSKNSTSNQNLWTNRVHLCRGHFKEYTVDNPLFGKLVGKYWWAPQVRGNKQKGIVVKDYQL